MRALILSDIHANIDALEAVIAAAPEYDVVWNLGDVVGYGASPNETVERVQSLGTVFVRGNHDRVCAGLRGVEDFNPVASKAALWTRRMLTPEHTSWLKGLAAGPIHPDGPAVSCVHGSLLNEDQYVLSIRDAWLPLREAATQFTFFGHTHVQGGFSADQYGCSRVEPKYRPSKDRGGISLAEFRVRFEPGRRYLLNPGSVGQPRDCDPRAAFAIFDQDAEEITFYRIPYDIRMAQMRILRASLPEKLAMRLMQGR